MSYIRGRSHIAALKVPRYGLAKDILLADATGRSANCRWNALP
jgi:hypothetical protein